MHSCLFVVGQLKGIDLFFYVFGMAISAAVVVALCVAATIGCINSVEKVITK